MFGKILLIVLGVSIFGIIFFLAVKRALKKKLDFYLNKNNNKN
tara:strand:- start:750 stop:878 length:129 start_codon:yes stop_codon:yes gene_type:complete